METVALRIVGLPDAPSSGRWPANWASSAATGLVAGAVAGIAAARFLVALGARVRRALAGADARSSIRLFGWISLVATRAAGPPGTFAVVVSIGLVSSLRHARTSSGYPRDGRHDGPRQRGLATAGRHRLRSSPA